MNICCYEQSASTHSKHISLMSHPSVDCGNPPDLDNGSPDFISTEFGEVATYTCDEGYQLATLASQRTCLSNGAW